MKISHMIAASALAGLAALALASNAFAALDISPHATGGPPAIMSCDDACALPSVDPFDAPACDVLGLVTMTACIPDLSLDVAAFATSAAPGGGLDPGRTWHGGMFVAPFLKVPSGVAGSVNRLRIDPGRVIYV